MSLRCATYIHPEDLDVKSIIDLQDTFREILARAEALDDALTDPDDPIITDD